MTEQTFKYYLLDYETNHLIELQDKPTKVNQMENMLEVGKKYSVELENRYSLYYAKGEVVELRLHYYSDDFIEEEFEKHGRVVEKEDLVLIPKDDALQFSFMKALRISKGLTKAIAKCHICKDLIYDIDDTEYEDSELCHDWCID